MINVTKVIDVIDHGGTTARFLPDGRLMKLDSCVIDEESVPDCLFFNIPENSCKALYGTERLKILIDERGFTGLRFSGLPRII